MTVYKHASVYSNFNPFSEHFSAIKDFKTLGGYQIVQTLFFTTLAGLLTLGTCATPVFRYFVEKGKIELPKSSCPVPKGIEIEELRKNVTNCARKYIGHIDHVSTNNRFQVDAYIFGAKINDFRVLFEPKCMPQKLINHYHTQPYKKEERVFVNGNAYRTFVKKQCQKILSGETPPNFFGKATLHMNCWEYVLLTYVNAGVISEEEARELCSICNEKGPLLVNAFYPKISDAKGAERVTTETLSQIKPGDVIFRTQQLQEGLVPWQESRPWHAAIYLGDKQFIENLGSGRVGDDVHTGLFHESDFKDNDVTAIPAESQPTELKLVESGSFADFPADSAPESSKVPSPSLLNSPMNGEEVLSTPRGEAPAGIADDVTDVITYLPLERVIRNIEEFIYGNRSLRSGDRKLKTIF